MTLIEICIKVLVVPGNLEWLWPMPGHYRNYWLFII